VSILHSSHVPTAGKGLRRSGLFVETASIVDFLRQCIASVLAGTTLFMGMPAGAAALSTERGPSVPYSAFNSGSEATNHQQSGSRQQLSVLSPQPHARRIALDARRSAQFDSTPQPDFSSQTGFFGQFDAAAP